MVGRSKQEKLDRLIGEVARGERTLAGISDPELREAVRIALRLHKDSEDLRGPDDYARMRMRVRVMAGLRPRAPTLFDNAWTALWYLGRPAPYIARAVVISSLVVAMGLGATLASADSLPDDALYPVKIAAESVRLALAGTPADRAAVELSMAEHRLAEAEHLAMSGRRSDALVASAIYTLHIAQAAAEISTQDDSASVGAQLETSFNAQRERAQRLATTLLADTSASSRGADVLAMIAASSMAPGETGAERVAETAAALATDLADAAESEAEADAIAFEEEQQSATAPDTRVDAAPEARDPLATANVRAAATTSPARTATTRTAATATPRAATATSRVASTTARATPRPTPDARASDNAKAARKAADQARAAAEKLKQALAKLKNQKEHH